MKPVIHSDREIMGGTPVFVGTRVPVQTLLDYIEGDEPLSEFLDQFPSVSKAQVMDFLRSGMSQLLSDVK